MCNHIQPPHDNYTNVEHMRTNLSNLRRVQLKGRLTRRSFHIVWWEKVCCFNSMLTFLLTCLQDDHDPIVFTILDCPCWPKWKVTDSLSALKCLGTDTLQFYDLEHKIWVEAPVSYPHTMTTDGYLLLRRPGVICKDFDECLVIAMQRPVTS